MTARNGYIEELIRTTHAQLFRARPLSVFCISNKMYKKNRRRVKVHDLPIKGSGIPALRRHCHKIPAQAQFRIGHHFLTVRLKGLVERLQLWLIGGSQETMPNDATVQRLLETLQDDLQKVSLTIMPNLFPQISSFFLNFNSIYMSRQVLENSYTMFTPSHSS